jgi:cation-transporting P-type ATPase E
MSNLPGLTSAEAAERQRRGLSNSVETKTSRPVIEIFKHHFLSVPNLILIAILLVLLGLGKFADALASGGVVVVNIILATAQEIQAKRKLDQIALLARPRVTVIRDGQEVMLDQGEVVQGDTLMLRSGDQAVVDGKRISVPGMEDKHLEMDESLLTGESDLIVKHPGDEILSGSFCVVGEGLYIAEKVGAESFAQKITSSAREFTWFATPLQRQIGILVRFMVVVSISLAILVALDAEYQDYSFSDAVSNVAVAVSLVPQGLLLMITVAYALGALRISGKGALVQQINAVESLSNVDVLCLDKTGTLTTNRILFDRLHPLNGDSEDDLRQQVADYISSTDSGSRTSEALGEALQGTNKKLRVEVPFSSKRKWAGASFDEGGTLILGAPEMILSNEDIRGRSLELAKQGLRVLLFAGSPHPLETTHEGREAALPADLEPLALISFSDELRPGVQEVLGNFRRSGIKLKLISGDNPDTVATLAYQAGFTPDEDRAISGLELAAMEDHQFARAVRENAIFGRITPEQKQRIVEQLRAQGHYVAMMGDGVNDVLSLKKAQVGIAMEAGSPATRAVADIVLMGNKFEVLPHAFMEGQRILNAMNDVNRLFLTRSLYTGLFIILVGFTGTPFPFTPRHNYLLTTFPIGLPAVALSAWAAIGPTTRNFLQNMSQFVVPAGISLMIMLSALWLLYLPSSQTHTEEEVDLARTVVTTAAMLAGYAIIWLSGRSREQFREGPIFALGDPRRVLLALVMVVPFAIISIIPSVREGFQLSALSTADLVTILVAFGVWLLAFPLMLKFDILERLIIPASPVKKD